MFICLGNGISINYYKLWHQGIHIHNNQWLKNQKINFFIMKYKKIFILSSCFSVLLFLLSIWSFFSSEIPDQSLGEGTNTKVLDYAGPLFGEIYDPLIGSIKSLQELKSMIHQAIEDNDLSGIEIPIYIDDLLRKKFLHGSSSIPLRGNWFLKFIDKTFPTKEITFSLSPNDIAKSNRAICSQQAVLFQELVQEFGFEYESVGFNIPLLEPVRGDADNEFNHYASAVKVENDWYYFDSNLEPEYDRYSSDIYNEILAGESARLSKLYPKYKWVEIKEGMIYNSNRNVFPAKNGLLIQQISKLISYYGWLVFLVISYFFYWLSKKNL